MATIASNKHDAKIETVQYARENLQIVYPRKWAWIVSCQ